MLPLSANECLPRGGYTKFSENYGASKRTVGEIGASEMYEDAQNRKWKEYATKQKKTVEYLTLAKKKFCKMFLQSLCDFGKLSKLLKKRQKFPPVLCLVNRKDKSCAEKERLKNLLLQNRLNDRG